jgi:hypothetical protein
MDEYGYESRRSRWALVGAAVLGAVVLLAAGFGIGHVSAPAAGSGQVIVNAQNGPGPTRVVNGVPVGYAHTEAGAVAAATNFLMVVDGPLVTQPDKYRSAIDTLAAPEEHGKLQQNAAGNTANLRSVISYAQQGHTVVYRSVPLAYRVSRSSNDSVQVSIWAEALLAVDGILSMRETWATTTLMVMWASGDWKLADIAAPTAPSFGPAPTMAQPAEQDVRLPPQLGNYRSYHVDVGA